MTSQKARDHGHPKAQPQPACLPCRRRKSRCKYEAAASECLMCRVHQTECTKPPHIPSRTARGNRTTPSRLQRREARAQTQPHTPVQADDTRYDDVRGSAQHVITHAQLPSTGRTYANVPEQPESGVSLETTEDENPHIVEPATAGDSHFLEEYLSSIRARDGGRIIRPVLPGVSAVPVVFMRVRKRPIGLSLDPNPAAIKLETILKLIEPHQDTLMRAYFARCNHCLPILDEDFFTKPMLRARISPAVLACLYAYAMCYWNHIDGLRSHRRPDDRFIWNLALEALYSELHVSPGMPSIIAILLNIGGRPTTTMVGNGMLLGCAVSLAKSLGLNRNPTPWSITAEEKTFRINIWWCLVIHDRWTSLTHGTPPQINHSHHDVPLPKRTMPQAHSVVFETLASLTTLLGLYLEELYAIGDTTRDHSLAAKLLAEISRWTDTLVGDMRRVMIRGTHLTAPGAANLRLCYLAARFFGLRLELSGEVDSIVPGQPLNERLLAARRAAEEVVLFTHELKSKQLGDFWLPAAAFVFSSVATFLVRIAVQIELPVCDTAAQSLSLSLANDLVSSLRSHKEADSWELGDVCLAQHGEVVDKLWSQGLAAPTDLSWLETASSVPDPLFIDSIVDDQWDPLLWS